MKEQQEKAPEQNLKARFFSQYWGQQVCYAGNANIQVAAGEVNELSLIRPEPFILVLKPLSSISDEDAECLGRYRYDDPKALSFKDIGHSIISDNLKRSTGKGDYMLELFEIDFLRSKGYALPFMQYSVDQLIELGWIKLTDTK